MNIKTYITKAALCAFLIPVSVLAQEAGNAPAAEPSEIDRYEDCMTQASSKPAEALNKALVWKEQEGGAPARHCEAVSLFNLAEYGEAAARFELIAADIRVGRGMPQVNGKKYAADKVMFASMLSQAAQAWLLAGELDKAHNAASQALSVVDKGSDVHIEVLLDRAQISAADEDFGLAMEDIEAALVFDPDNLTALLFKAAAQRAIGRFLEAKKAVDLAYTIDAGNPSVLLERANIAYMLGDKKSAHTDLLTIIRDYPDSHAAPSARINLERMALQELR